MDVPQGTVAEVLEWVGDDPGRAAAALKAERDGSNRSTLIAQLEAIATEEANAVTETTFDPSTTASDGAYDEESGLAPGPEAPEVYVDTGDNATTVFPPTLAHPDVDYQEERDDEGNVVLPEATTVESIAGAVAPHGCILVLNGEAFAFSPQMVGALRMVVNSATAGVTL